ncbi:hypothetical protein ACHAO1_010533 [Botrytis cinerea]
MCDNCFEFTKPPHESYDCNESPGKSCKSCGHAVCLKNKCSELGGKKISEIGQDTVDRFTPKARDAWIKKYGPQSSAAFSAASQASANTPGPSQSLAEPVADNRTTEEKLQGLYDEESRKIPQAASQAWNPFTTINANFYKVGLNSKAEIFKYSICLGKIIPRGKSEGFVPTRPETKRYLTTRLLEENKHLFESISWASDYDSFIVSNKPLREHDLSKVGHSISTPHTRSGPNGKPMNMDSSLTYLGLVNVKALMDHVKSMNAPLDHPEDELKFLNIISWKKVNSPQYEGGRVGKKFYPHSFVADDEEWMSKQRVKRAEQGDILLIFKDDDKAPLYQIHRGFFSSMRPGKGSIFLNVNVTTSAFFSPINLAKWIESNPIAWGDSERLLKGVRVVFDIHAKNRQKVFNIKSIAPRNVSETKFSKDGKEISVHAYMNDTYPKNMFNKNARCINVGSNAEPTWFPADHLKIVEWQIVKKNLPEPYVAAMIDATKRPQQSKVAIKETALGELDFLEEDPFYKAFGITPVTNLVEIKAGTLEAPALLLGGGTDRVLAHHGSWELKSKKCRKPGIENPTLYVLWLRNAGKSEHAQNEMQDATNTLVVSLEAFGLNQIKGRVFCQAIVPEENLDPEDYRQTCARTFENALRPVFKGARTVPLVMVVLPVRSRKLYPEIKRWGDCVIGIPTVCVLEKTLSKGGDRARCGNISLKFNLKLGGVNQEVSEGCGIKARTMVVGADVTHPGDEEGCPSIAAVVATDDNSQFKYLGSARLQEGKQEYISDLRGMMRERLLVWARRVLEGPPGLGGVYPKILPDHILFYRDGVSESQFGMVRHHETQQIFDGCSDAYTEMKRHLEKNRLKTLLKVPGGEKWKPKLTLIVAIKRHHTRFYPLTLVDGDPNLNAGTIIDSIVVTPNHFSFYLQSHCSPLGTARSTQYVVIYDDLDYKSTPQSIMNITNKLCYTGARASKALSVCTPARYADLLCDRVRCYLKPVLEGYLDKSSTNDMDGTQRAAIYGENTLVWKPNTSDKLESGWKNPWHPSLSDVMFYL